MSCFHLGAPGQPLRDSLVRRQHDQSYALESHTQRPHQGRTGMRARTGGRKTEGNVSPLPSLSFHLGDSDHHPHYFLSDVLTWAANGTSISIQTGSHFLDEDFILRKVTPGLFNWWQKNSSDPVNERSSSLQFQGVPALPLSLQTLGHGLRGVPTLSGRSPGPLWTAGTSAHLFISVLVIFYSFVLLASTKTVTIFYYSITVGDDILNSNAYLPYLVLLH